MKTSLSVRSSEYHDGPDDTCMLRLEVTQLRTYDRNPRRCQNGEYERIKASIRAEGLDQPLVVTRRPGEESYMPLAGGNTRLRAMLSLYEETGGDAFRYLDCLFKPWVAESDILLSHLRENELRDALHFIDKARAVFEAKALIEEEMQGRTLSQRRLSEMMAARGLSFSQTLISHMAYAVHTLWPLIPQALSAGMGSPQVVRIQSLERAARAIWLNRSIGAEEEFNQIFAALSRRFDSPDWVTDVLQDALEVELADASGVDLALVRVELDAQINGKASPPVAASAQRLFEEGPAKPEMERVMLGRSNGQVELIPAHGDTVSKNLEESGVAVVEQDELERLRQRAYQLAAQLADSHGMAQAIKPLSGQGIGFLVLDPKGEKFVELSEEHWQTLAALTDTYRALHRISQDSGTPLWQA